MIEHCANCAKEDNGTFRLIRDETNRIHLFCSENCLNEWNKSFLEWLNKKMNGEYS